MSEEFSVLDAPAAAVPAPVVTGPAADRPPTTRRRVDRSRIGWTAVALTSLAIAGYSLALYAQGSLQTMAAAEVGLAGAYASAPGIVQVAFFGHIVTACLALLLGPWQFSRWLRDRYRRAHRWVGRTYLVSVGLGSGTALVIAPYNSAAMVGFFGFGGLAVLWALTAFRGYQAVRRRDLAGHQAWMIRNYALTYAATTLRLWMGILIVVQLPFAGPDADPDALFATAYHAVPFLCWLPNLVVAEWLIRRRGLPSYRLTSSRAS